LVFFKLPEGRFIYIYPFDNRKISASSFNQPPNTVINKRKNLPIWGALMDHARGTSNAMIFFIFTRKLFSGRSPYLNNRFQQVAKIESRILEISTFLV